MTTEVLNDPDDWEAGATLVDYKNNIYCEWEWNQEIQQLVVNLPLQQKTIKVPLEFYDLNDPVYTEDVKKKLFLQLAKNEADNHYSRSQLWDDLKRVPDDDEINRLVSEYPTFYSKPYRIGFLHQLLAGKPHASMAAAKMEYDGHDPTEKGPKGKAVVWTKKKAKKVALRLLYLEFVEDDEMSRGDAVEKLMNWYGHLTNATTERNIYAATERPCDTESSTK